MKPLRATDNMVLGLAVVLAVGGTSSTGMCQAGDRNSDIAPFIAKLETLIPALLDEAMVPGAAVALISNGAIVHIEGYGYADVAKKKPVTRKTGFNIGSISKTVAAWGVMKLVEREQLELDKPVAQYLNRWHIPDSEFDKHGVTIRRLLSHTAGLSLHGYPGFGPDDTLPAIEQSLTGKTNGSGDVRLIMEPGTKWKYSGGGYTTAQLIVEEVTDRTFAEFMRSEVLRPLGMTNSDYELKPAILAASSLCYDTFGELTPNPRFTAQAAAGLHTTIEDFAKFAVAALNGPAGEMPGRGVLEPASVVKMMSPVPVSDGFYGLGYSVGKLPNGNEFKGHGGANCGWHAVFRVVPQTGDGIVVTTNGSNGGYVHRQVTCAWTEWITGESPKTGCKKSVRFSVLRALRFGGPDAAVSTYKRLRKTEQAAYSFDENTLNNLGYELLGKQRLDDALAILKLNAEAFPQSFNPYDSLGEAYMIKGQKDLAIKNYEKSLELNPKNDNARKMIAKLKDDGV